MQLSPRGFIAAVVLLSPLVHAAEKSPGKPGVPFRAVPFAAGCRAADAEKKFVFIDFFTTWCGPCKALDDKTWKDEAVAKLLGEKTVPLRIDAEKEVALAKRYKVEAYPTLLLIKPDGTEVDRLVGYRDAPQFVEEITASFAGKTALVRAQEAVSASATDHDAVQARYRLGDTLTRDGKYAEALREYLWCYDEGMVVEKSFVGVRDSFLLSSIARLGRKYPAALAELRVRRDKAQQQMQDDPHARGAAMDFASLNDALNENKRTLEVFDQLPPEDPRREGLMVRVYGLLIDAQRYNEAAKAVPFQRMEDEFARSCQQMPRIEAIAAANSGPPSTFRTYIVQSTAKNIEVLVGSGQLASARALGAKVLELDHSPGTRHVLHAVAARAGHPELWPEEAPQKE